MSDQFIQWEGFWTFNDLPDDIRELVSEIKFTIPSHGKVTIMPGFKFDGASIPRLFWTLIGSPFTGKYKRAALLHDALYAAEIFSRKVCDEIFLQYMKEEKVSWWRRNSMWLAVRAFGGTVWSKHTTESVKEASGLVLLEEAWLT